MWCGWLAGWLAALAGPVCAVLRCLKSVDYYRVFGVYTYHNRSVSQPATPSAAMAIQCQCHLIITLSVSPAYACL